MAKPYRILHIIDHLGPGGAQEALLNLVKFADRSRFELEVATMHGFGVYWELLQQDGVRLHSLSPHKFAPCISPTWQACCVGAVLSWRTAISSRPT